MPTYPFKNASHSEIHRIELKTPYELGFLTSLLTKYKKNY